MNLDRAAVDGVPAKSPRGRTPSQTALDLYARLAAGIVSQEQVDPRDRAALETVGLVRSTDAGLEVLAPFAAIDAIVRAGTDAAARAHDVAGRLEKA
jgi:hypothetical protein